MKYQHLLLLSALLVFSSCSKNEITLPPYNAEANLENTLDISDTTMEKMEGIYLLGTGNGTLGSQFVCKVTRRRVSFFSDKEGIFMILKFGFNPLDSSIQFAGFWRYSENSTQGNIGFAISKDDGAMDLIQNGNAGSIILNGIFMDVDYYTKTFTMQFNRPFSNNALTREFAIFGHHGIQTTANPPYAENSINVVLNGSSYGVTGMEFDVRMTKDHVPICIHDPSINTRLTLKGPLSGNWDQYSFSLLSSYIRLKDGQKVASVEQILDTFIVATDLKYMWLDIKGNKDVFKYLEPIVRNAMAKAASLGRNVEIITDLPSQSVIDEYQTQPSYIGLPVMCELTLQDVIDNQCQFWGPRYSEGLLLDDVDRAHGLGIRVYSWTLNDKNIIRSYLQDGRFDGFISDYPAYVVYDFYTQP